MDRIRTALDLARLERVQADSTPRVDRSATRDKRAEPYVLPLPTVIEYTRTKVFTAQPGHLERNRVMDPAASDPAAAAYRMLRTQVLQRLDAHAWRSLAIFSAGPEEGKTTTAINLAVSLASDHLHTVLLVDFDFKRPTLAPTGFPAGVGESCNGLRRVTSAPSRTSPFTAASVSKNPQPVVS